MAHEPLFGRVATLTVGPPGAQGRVWTGLRIQFHVHKTGDASPNKAEVTITNLAQDARRYLEHGGRYSGAPAYAVILSAGYQGDAKQILSARLELATSEHQRADWETHLSTLDGAIERRSIVISKTFGPKTSEESIIREVANAMGVTLGTLKGFSKKQTNHGRSLTGAAAYELDKLCASQKVRWSITDGVLHILPYGSALNPTAIVVSPATGMIGSPQKTERGVKVESLLRGEANPGRLIRLQSAEINGDYVVEDVIHEGDTHGELWRSTIEAIPLTS